MKYKYRNEMAQVIHEDMQGSHKLGIISDAEMRKFDKLCLVQEPETADEAEELIEHITE